MEELIKVLKNTGLPVYHTPADANAALPYIAYTEYAESYLKADNIIDDVKVYVQVDFYTKTEFDPYKRRIRQALNDAETMFKYDCLYDAEEKVYHHIFDCEVFEDGKL